MAVVYAYICAKIYKTRLKMCLNFDQYVCINSKCVTLLLVV